MEPLCVQIISAVPINQKLYSSAEKVWGEVCVTKRKFLRWAGVTKRTNVAGSNHGGSGQIMEVEKTSMVKSASFAR